jgi:type IV pilus assembly protein PilF
MDRLSRDCITSGLLSLLFVLVAGCSSTPKPATPPQPELPPIKQPEVSLQDRAKLHLELGAGYYERGQMDIAIEELDEAVKLDPGNARIYNIYGLVYAWMGENAKAEQNFQRALSLAPQDSEARQNWGWFLCTTGRARQSIPEFELAVANPLYKAPEVALINAARCSTSFGDVANAESYFKRALTIAPNNASAAYGLAQLAYKANRYDEARVWIRRAVTQANPTPEALFLGMCIERRQATGPWSCRMSRSCAIGIRPAETKAIATGCCV